jgi:hypothetical protein
MMEVIKTKDMLVWYKKQKREYPAFGPNSLLAF